MKNLKQILPQIPSPIRQMIKVAWSCGYDPEANDLSDAFNWKNNYVFNDHVFWWAIYEEIKALSMSNMKPTQFELLQEIKGQARINIVTCGHCGTVILHRVDDEDIECYDCNEVLNPEACPDLFHEEFQK